MKPRHSKPKFVTTLCAACVSLIPGAVGAKAPANEERAETATSADALQQIVRGLYIEARVGAGYMVVNDKLEASQQFPDIGGASEALGVGSSVVMAVGYDINETVALQGLSGVTMVSGSRRDRVRDLGLLFGGLGLRLSFILGDRFFLFVSPGLAYVRADDGVDPPTGGVAAHAATGVEYYVHVRHFSVGIDVSGFVPVSPFRTFVAITPRIKYTF